ncbi:RNA-binding domain-containing protein [Streptomyces sp. NPDC093598]|uniref:RNA-binding domain-containing protein n=1 Tax=Streptomyces sp. NPDC093598 TaxID=3366046 RepID=UPI00380D098C
MLETSEEEGLLALLPSQEEYLQRLSLIFPATAAGAPHGASPGAAALVFVALYVGSVDGVRPINIVAVTTMSDSIAARRSETDRLAYYEAVTGAGGETAVRRLCDQAGFPRGTPWYKPNSREYLRAEPVKALLTTGALLTAALPPTSPRPRYSLDSSFAALFAPELSGDSLTLAIKRWRAKLAPTAPSPAADNRFALSHAYSAIVCGNPEALLGRKECKWLDVKSQPYKLGNYAADEELCKDVASFANLQGGLLVIGFSTVAKQDGEIIETITPLLVTETNRDQYRKILRSRIKPYIRGLEIEWCSIDSETGVLGIYIPQQPDALKPFILSSKRDPTAVKCPIRDADGTHWLSADELARYLSLGWNTTH